jgi:hypothetical protein
MKFVAGPAHLSSMDTLVPANVATRREDNEKDNHDAKEDEGDGTEGDFIKITSGKCS